MNKYFKVNGENCTKIIRASDTDCEVYIRTPRGSSWQHRDEPYNIYVEINFSEISVEQFIFEIALIDIPQKREVLPFIHHGI